MKLAIGALVGVALALLGGLVWVAADDGGPDRRAAEIGAEAELVEDEPLKEGPSGSVRWRGAFSCDGVEEVPYEALDLVGHNGSTYIAKATINECIEPPKEPWDLFARGGENGVAGAQGPQGPAGTFTGTFQSPDGNYRLTVSNAGIRAEGPTGRWYLDSGGVTLDGAVAVTVRSATTLDLSANAGATLRGATLRLGCASGGQRVARLGDQTTGSQIAQGSATVLAC